MSELINLGSETQKSSAKLTSTGKILIGITGGIAVGLSIICVPFVSPALRKICLPYIPATDQQISNVLQALKSIQKGKLIDLGSGDGRIVFEAAHKGLTAHGVELNPWLVLYSKFDAVRKGLNQQTHFFRKDLWKFDISSYDRVVIFGVEQMMSDLEVKIMKECKSDCKIVACRFPLPNLKPIQTIGHGVDAVWVYEVPTANS